MPLVKMKKVWTYCTYNKPFFLLILLLYGILNFFQDVYGDTGDGWILLIIFAVSILIIGYGMTITHDRINNGVRLPKIMIKEVMVLEVFWIGYPPLSIFRVLNWRRCCWTCPIP